MGNLQHVSTRHIHLRESISREDIPNHSLTVHAFGVYISNYEKDASTTGTVQFSSAAPACNRGQGFRITLRYLCG